VWLGERHAWTLLRNRGVLGLKFRRQHALHGFIVDFCCLSERIANCKSRSEGMVSASTQTPTRREDLTFAF